MVIGIDLGTTYCAVGIWQGESYTLIPNIHGKLLTPSVISVSDEGAVLIGDAAKSRLISHSSQTASQFKRTMGTTKIFNLGKRKFNSVELSSLMLRQLKSDAEAFTEQKIDKAVISVPAYFNEQQRKATVNAADLIGLKVERLINEPTAAAIAYGLHDNEDDIKYLVLDLGGGTFDVTLLEYFDKVMEVHATAGDNHLGGEDFTESLCHFVKKKYSLATLSSLEQQKLYAEMEQLKQGLSQNSLTTVEIELAGKEVSVEISADDFAKLTKPLVQRILQPVQRVLSDANITPEAIDKVILVGGASRMPHFRQAVAKMLRKLPLSHLDPDLVVASGAAIQAGLKENSEALKEVVLTDVTPYSMGVGIHNGDDKLKKIGNYFSPIIERNTIVPVSRISQYVTVVDNQKEILLEIYQGESRFVRNNVYLGEIVAKVPKKRAGEEAINVRFSYDMNGLLDVDLEVVSTGEKQNKVFVQNHLDMSEEEKKSALKKLQKLKFHPREQQENLAFSARLDKLFEMSLSHKREIVGQLLEQWESALASQKSDVIKIAKEQIEQELTSLERPSW